MYNYDIAINKQIGFQDPATPIMEGIIDLHHNILFYLIVIFILVLWILLRIFQRNAVMWSFVATKNDVYQRTNYLLFNKITHGTWLEVIWTLIPSVILMLIAIPSFVLLYSIDEIMSPLVTIKVLGYQWYWIYEYSDYDNQIRYKSYQISSNNLNLGDFRLLEVDHPLLLPINTHIRILVTSADVLHSWAIPSLGVKIDAVPGRLNQISVFLKREGTFYGQCSEICGVYHGFMPIVVTGVTIVDYLSWIKTIDYNI
jgi:cytochrome c oxidase subunit 2